MKDISRSLLKGWKALIVDDEEDSLEVAQVVLESHGASVYTARNGLDALHAARSLKPHFVISDLSMPIMDGWEFIAAIQRDVALREIPVIALTANDMPGFRARAMAAGFHNYLTKPLTATTFIHNLAVLLVDVPAYAILPFPEPIYLQRPA
jgi:CheY-like chemotaxis protein